MNLKDRLSVLAVYILLHFILINSSIVKETVESTTTAVVTRLRSEVLIKRLQSACAT